MKKLSVLFVAIALLAAACGGAEETEVAEVPETDDSVTVTQGVESALDRVSESGVVRIGVRNDNPPMSFLNDDGDWVGFDLEFAEAIADELGAELELVPVDGTTRISFLESGQVDMSVASMNHTRSLSLIHI